MTRADVCHMESGEEISPENPGLIKFVIDLARSGVNTLLPRKKPEPSKKPILDADARSDISCLRAHQESYFGLR